MIAINKVFLINNICCEKYRFKNALKDFSLFVEEATPEQWILYTLGHPSCPYQLTPLLRKIVDDAWKTDIWIHVWDDSPLSGKEFQKKLAMCNAEKNFFVLYGYYSEKFIDELIESRFGKLYPDIKKRIQHIIIIKE